MNKNKSKDKQFEDLQWQFTFISDPDFDFEYFVKSLINYRVNHFKEKKQDLLNTLK
ncbi:MAG: hypothetical protein IGQ45_15815 [Cyanobacterium sp. T60_A2020_053]|nr:hypothetical protein [Cyanobacterium sp. T60_A2020_053]